MNLHSQDRSIPYFGDDDKGIVAGLASILTAMSIL